MSEKVNLDEYDVFGKHIALSPAFSLHQIDDGRNKEFAKLKIQGILFRAHDGQLLRDGRVNQVFCQTQIYPFPDLSFPRQAPINTHM